MTRRFQRNCEDFECVVCGRAVRGNGYTNHCPHCLWSRHVDINPGDRSSDCGGLMRPVALEVRAGAYVIMHRCDRCGFERRNKTVAEDDFGAILALSAGTRSRP